MAQFAVAHTAQSASCEHFTVADCQGQIFPGDGGGGGGGGGEDRHEHRLPLAHGGGLVQYFCSAQPAALKPGGNSRHVDSHAISHRSAFPALAQSGATAGAGGGVGGGGAGGVGGAGGARLLQVSHLKYEWSIHDDPTGQFQQLPPSFPQSALV